MDITDTCSKHVYAKISDCLTFFRICTLTHTYNAVFFSTDRTNFTLDRKTKLMSYVYELCRLSKVLFEWIVRTIKHDRCETSLDTLITSFVCSMIQMKCYWNCDSKFLVHSLNHSCNCLESCHILSGTLRYTKDNWGV